MKINYSYIMRLALKISKNFQTSLKQQKMHFIRFKGKENLGPADPKAHLNPRRGNAGFCQRVSVSEARVASSFTPANPVTLVVKSRSR